MQQKQARLLSKTGKGSRDVQNFFPRARHTPKSEIRHLGITVTRSKSNALQSLRASKHSRII